MQDFRTETFLTVCRTLNYTRAAEELHITQPAVSQHIAHLEKSYGVPLFTYHNKRLALTKAGALLRDTLATMSHDEQMLRERMAGMTTGRPIKLTVGMTLTAGEYLVAAPLADYLATHPDLCVAVRSGATSELVHLLDIGEIDCAFVEGFFDKSFYAWNVFKTERLVCVCSPNHVFKHKPRLLEDLLEEHLLVRETGSGTRAVLEHALAAQNLSLEGFESVSAVESLDIIKVFVERDLGISFLYEAAVTRELAAGTLCEAPLRSAPIEHDISFIRLRDSVFEPESQHLFESLVTTVSLASQMTA